MNKLTGLVLLILLVSLLSACAKFRSEGEVSILRLHLGSHSDRE